MGSIIGAVKEGAGTSKTEQLTKFLKDGKKLIISTVQTFPFALDTISNSHRGGKFAIIIDEAHSSQGGKTASAVSQVVAGTENDQLERVWEVAGVLRAEECRRGVANSPAARYKPVARPPIPAY